MIVGVMSDTHLSGDVGSLDKLLAGPLGGADALIHVGDFTSEGALDRLDIDDPRLFFGVAGNTDSGRIRKRLADRRIVDLDGFRVGLVHIYSEKLMHWDGATAYFGEGVDVVIFGHTHRPLVHRADGILFLNPGSPFDKRFEPVRTCALLELSPRGAQPSILELGP